MPKFVGTRNDRIHLVSSAAFEPTGNDVVVAVPEQYVDVSPEKLITDFKIKRGNLVPKHRSVPIREMRLAFVGNWKMQCGISTYSENLWPAVASHVEDFKLFVEFNDVPTGPNNVVGNTVIEPERVVACWRRGGPLSTLVNELKAYDPDIVWIQHEFGLWPDARHWLSMMSQLSESHRVIVTMHSVFHHRDKTVIEAAMPEIVVHLEGAKKVLQEEKGIAAPIHVIPHGCSSVVDHDRLWNVYKSSHTLVQFGFGFEYKGWEQSIMTTAILKKEFPDVFFTGLFSESPFNKVSHQLYYDKLISMVNDLGLQDNVALIRGFQSDQALDSYLRTNRVALFPYVSDPVHEVFGASGAARFAMSCAVPVVTSLVNHFSDIPTIKAVGPEAMAAEIKRLFNNDLAWKKQVDAQLTYLNDNSWAQIALRYVELFEKPPTNS